MKCDLRCPMNLLSRFIISGTLIVACIAVQPQQDLRSAPRHTTQASGAVSKKPFCPPKEVREERICPQKPSAHSKRLGCTALMQAAEGGNLEGVRVLVRQGADVNLAIRPWGLTALMLATGKGHLEIVKTLLKAGANPNAVAFGHGGVPGWAWMAAMNRCHERWLEMTDAMLAAGVELNPKSIYPSPLGYAINENDTVMIQALLKRGANVNLADSETGDTLLIFAARFSTPEVVEALIQAGADVNARNTSGQTVLTLADQNDNLWRKEIVELLRKRGAKL